MRIEYLLNKLPTLYRHCELFAAAGLLVALAGCGSTTQTASPPVTTTPATAKAKFIYTGNQGASLSGYAVDAATGALTPLSGFPLAVGISPESVTHDPQNRFLFASDISAETLRVYAINAATGALTEVAPSPYNTMIESEGVVVDPSGTHLYLYRTGASASYPGVAGNQIVAYNLDSFGVLSPVQGSPFLVGTPGAVLQSATGMVIDTAGKHFYLQTTTSLYSFAIDATSGGLTMLQTFASQFGGLALDPTGSYLYVAGSNFLLAYAVDPVSGLLSLAKSSPTVKQSGAYTLALAPNGKFAYTIENNNDLVSYSLSNGAFAPIGTIFSSVYGQQIALDPSSNFLYVPQTCSSCPSGLYNVIHQFSIAQNGTLTPLASPTVPSGVTPFGITVVSQ